MGIVNDLLDRWKQMAADRSMWEKHWFDIATYSLPDAERFDRMFATGDLPTVTNSVVSEPVASRRGREIYDMTSLWAIDRGANGTMSLVTPQTSVWHDLEMDDPYGAAEANDEEARWLEQLRDYLFKLRANPQSGFWQNHKAALRCKWAFGTAVTYIRDTGLGPYAPVGYAFVPLSENHLATNFEGVPDTDFRVFSRSARQCVARWGDRCSPKVQVMAESEKDKDRLISILHAVMPREEKGTYGNTNRESPWTSCHVEIDEKHLISESGFFEFPFRVDYWQRNNPGPYAEGPIALALADIKSLNLLAKTALRAAQQWTDPPLITHSDVAGVRLNLNPRAINPGYVTDDGRPRALPLTTGRPDFAETVLETKRQQLRTTLYVELWTTIIDSEREQTAYEVAIKNQERADLIGPIGTSLQTSLAHQVDREIGILERAGTFYPGSKLAPPESAEERPIAPHWTSPLDRARKLGELQGVQQLWVFAQAIAAATGDPSALDKLDPDASIDFAQEVLGAPRKIVVPDDEVAEIRDRRRRAAEADDALERAERAGIAGQAAAAGAEAMAASPAASEVLKQIAGVAG